jgi:NAD-dependent DNA ligase (contains BRCT domain type II)
MKNPYLNKQDRVDLMQRKLIIYSIAYYEFSNNIISDMVYDKLAKRYYKAMASSGDLLEASQYYYCMKDFHPSTGFDIYKKLNKKDKKYLTKMTNHILSLK